FRKIFKALAPGGVFLNGDYFACCPEEETLLRATLERRRAAEGIPPERFVHFDTPLTVEHETQVLRAAGFSEVFVAARTDGAAVLSAQKA
ncbi:MAG: methyltransferase, partial [Acutalibacteraceae bacterium]